MKDDRFPITGMDDGGNPMEEGGTSQDSPDGRPIAAPAGAKLIVKKDGETLLEYAITSFPVTIGRKSDNHVVLEDKNVSRKHAEIQESAGQYILRDLGSTGGTKCNGEVVSEKELHTGDTIGVGSYTLVFHSGRADDERTVFETDQTQLEEGTALDEDRTRFYEEPEAKLVVVKSDSVQGEFVVQDEALVLGRDKDANIPVDDKRISRKHCQVFRDGAVFKVKDLGSANGTFVNGQKVTEKALANGDRIQVGSTVFEFRMILTAKPSPRKGLATLLKGLFFLVLIAAVAYGAYKLIPSLRFGKSGPTIMQSLWEYTTRASIATTPGVGDLNGDGYLNIVAADVEGTLYGLDGRQGGLVWNSDFSSRGGTILGSPKLVDINRQDGELDVVLGTASKGVLAMDGGTMRPIWWGKAGSEVITSAAVADVNDDGTPDVAVGTREGLVICFDGRQGGPIWTFATGGPVESSPVMADLNGDRIPDVIAGSTDDRVTTLDGRNGKTIWVYAGTEDPSTAAAADFNGDRVPDVVFMTPVEIIVLEGTKGALIWTWEMPRAALPTETDPYIPLQPALCDLNGDKVPDVIVSTPGGHLFAVDGRTGQGYLWDYGIGAARKTSPALCDFNRDGVSDIAVGDTAGNLILIDGATGHELSRLKVGSGIQAAPVIADFSATGIATLVVGTTDRKIVAVQTQSKIPRGSVQWGSFGGDLLNSGYSK